MYTDRNIVINHTKSREYISNHLVDIEMQKFTKKAGLGDLKWDLSKLDINELNTVPDDFYNLESDVNRCR